MEGRGGGSDVGVGGDVGVAPMEGAMKIRLGHAQRVLFHQAATTDVAERGLY